MLENPGWQTRSLMGIFLSTWGTKVMLHEFHSLWNHQQLNSFWILCSNKQRNIKAMYYCSPVNAGIHRYHLTSIGIPMLMIMQSHNHFIFNMGIPIAEKKRQSLHWNKALLFLIQVQCYILLTLMPQSLQIYNRDMLEIYMGEIYSKYICSPFY